MKKIKCIATIMALLCCTVAFAQQGLFTYMLNYSVATPLGSFKNFISNNSVNGYGAEIMYHTSNRLAVGMEINSQDFYQKFPRQLYKAADGSDVSAVRVNSIWLVPFLARAQYYFLSGSAVRPYIALAAGFSSITYNQSEGEYSNETRATVGFTARPEAGIYIPFKKYSRAGFSLSTGYNFMPYNYGDINDLNSLVVKAGISY